MSIRRNTAYNMVGHVFSLAIMLATVPLYLKVIGAERFGVLSIIWLLLGYFGFFDFGLGRAVAHRLAQLRGSVAKERQAVLWTAILSVLLLGTVGALLLYFIAGIALSSWIRISDLLQAELDGVRLWVSLSLVPLVLSGVLSGVLVGTRKFLRLNVVDGLGKLLLQILPLGTALLFGPSLENLAAAVFVARLLSVIGWVAVCQRILPFLGALAWNTGLVEGLWRYGGWVTISALVGPILTSVERLVLGAIVGAAAVTYYTVPHSVISPITLFAGSLGAALFPLFASVGGEENRYLEKWAASFVVATITPLLVGLTFFVHPFLSYWISVDFADKTAVVPQVLIPGFWANSIALIAHARLQGNGRPRVVAAVHVGEMLPYLLVLYLLVGEGGIVGASIAWSLRAVVDALLLGGKSGLLMKFGTDLLFPFVLVLFSVSISIAMVSAEQRFLLIGGVLAFSATAWWSWHRGLDSRMRNELLSLVRRTASR